MDRYHLVSHLGTGRFGSVWKAIDQTNNKVVAIKRLHEKYHSENKCVNMEELIFVEFKQTYQHCEVKKIYF